MTPAREEARRLLRLARRDSDTFALLLPLPKATMAALGFHAQQAVEKALKAVCTGTALRCGAPTISRHWDKLCWTRERHCQFQWMNFAVLIRLQWNFGTTTK